MVYQSVQKHESGFTTVISKRVEGGYTVRLNDDNDVECVVLTVPGVEAPPTDIAEAVEVAYRAGRDDGRIATRQSMLEAIEKAWKGTVYGA